MAADTEAVTAELEASAAPEEGDGGWEMADTDAHGGGAERILNQDEIDSLLGFDLSDDDAAERTGIRAIINSALVSYERLPMLEIVFDRLGPLVNTSFRNFPSEHGEGSLHRI